MANQSALKLIADYGNDGESSDDDVPGAKVSTKRPYKHDSPSRLPVPDCLKKLKVDPSWIDEPSEHQGRVRSFQHERGNWATFVYVPYEAHRGLHNLIETIIDSIPSLTFNKIDDFHISLTKTVILKHHWIFPLVNSIKERTCRYGRFISMFGNLKVYCNEERTRTFIGIEMKSGYDTLCLLVADLDKCLSEFQLPQFYEDPSFHMSILWCLGDMEYQLSEYLPQLNAKLQQIMADYPEENWFIVANYLYCKAGNKMFQFPLL